MIDSYFEVLRPGINTTFQDEGRFFMQHLGVAPSGCMDHKSFLIANALVGNNCSNGVLEFAYQGPLLKLIQGKTKFVITGNVIFQIINTKNEKINGVCNRSYDLKEGEQIDILATKESAYGYLAVEGSFELKSFCNSISTLSRAGIGPNEGKKLNKDTKIKIKKNSNNKKNYITKISYDNNNIIKILEGPQYKYFSEISKKNFFSKDYKITNLTDRMGMRLEGTKIENIKSTNIRSEGITKGAIQVPADGQPIILLTEHPTIGGYPKIANVISADYDKLVQKIPGEKILFQKVKLHEAEQLYKEHLNSISAIIKNIKELN